MYLKTNVSVKQLITFLILIISTVMCSEKKESDSANKTPSPQAQMQPEQKTVASTTGEKAVEGLKVTFIELGSVKCIPCKMMQPVMEQVEKEYAGQVKVVFHDVWTPEGQPYGQQYGIQAIPTQVFLDAEGKEYYRHTGFFPKDELVKVLQMKGVK